MVRLMAVASFRFRSFGSRNMPPEGPVLVCSNHQSHLDPVLVGMVFGRRLNFIARKSLFKFALLRWLIQFLDAIPINRDGMGLEGIKESIRRLRRGEVVLIFPEGTRTTDGELAQLKPGFCALTRRTKAALLPVAIDGAYQAWPRNSSENFTSESRPAICRCAATTIPCRRHLHASRPVPIRPPIHVAFDWSPTTRRRRILRGKEIVSLKSRLRLF